MLFVPALIAAFASSTAAMAAVAVVSDNINKNKIRVVPPEKKGPAYEREDLKWVIYKQLLAQYLAW